MGWTRNDVARLYRDRDGSYVFVNIVDGTNGADCYDAIGNVHSGPKPSLGSTGIQRGYLRRCKRVEWSDMPLEWQGAFMPWLKGIGGHPRDIKGLHRKKAKARI